MKKQLIPSGSFSRLHNLLTWAFWACLGLIHFLLSLYFPLIISFPFFLCTPLQHPVSSPPSSNPPCVTDDTTKAEEGSRLLTSELVNHPWQVAELIIKTDSFFKSLNYYRVQRIKLMHVSTPDNVSVRILEWLLGALFDKSLLTAGYGKKEHVREASKILTLSHIFVKLL